MTTKTIISKTHQELVSVGTSSRGDELLSWLERVIRFAVEDEPQFVPDTVLLKELWEFGAPAGGAAENCVRHFHEVKMKQRSLPAKVSFIFIKDKQVQTAETIDGDVDAIERRINRIQSEGFDAAVAVFGDGLKWDISFPMTASEIEKMSVKLHRNL